MTIDEAVEEARSNLTASIEFLDKVRHSGQVIDCAATILAKASNYHPSMRLAMIGTADAALVLSAVMFEAGRRYGQAQLVGASANS